MLPLANPVEVHLKVEKAISDFLERDLYLLRVNVSERAMTHRLAVHLERQFPDWDVDCEFNRDGNVAKMISFLGREEGDGEEGSSIYPDVIVHHRGTGDNLLVLEVKKAAFQRLRDRDIEKLTALREQLRYRFACFVMIDCDSRRLGVTETTWI